MSYKSLGLIPMSSCYNGMSMKTDGSCYCIANASINAQDNICRCNPGYTRNWPQENECKPVPCPAGFLFKAEAGGCVRGPCPPGYDWNAAGTQCDPVKAAPPAVVAAHSAKSGGSDVPVWVWVAGAAALVGVVYFTKKK